MRFATCNAYHSLSTVPLLSAPRTSAFRANRNPPACTSSPLKAIALCTLIGGFIKHAVLVADQISARFSTSSRRCLFPEIRFRGDSRFRPRLIGKTELGGLKLGSYRPYIIPVYSVKSFDGCDAKTAGKDYLFAISISILASAPIIPRPSDVRC